MQSRRANFSTNSFTRRLLLLGLLCIVSAGLGFFLLRGYKDTNKASALHRWDLVAEGENKELYFIDRRAMTRVSEGIVRVDVKYVPSKDQFLISLQEISRQFGKEVVEADYEYTVSTWEFDCTGGVGRCLNLNHFRKGQKIAAYDYPEQKWSSLDKTNSTKVLRDLICRQVTQPEKQK